LCGIHSIKIDESVEGKKAANLFVGVAARDD
jgi:hypothetical protein